ncbi:MAG: hypothetical protein LUF78_07410 [Clostridiales bacterium]|nr:hypothetical protein [Clostridiales bacterium]
MTGSLKTRRTSSGKEYFYVRLSYKDPHSQNWRTKEIKTGLEVKGNKRRAEGLIKKFIEEYAYLEKIPGIHGEIQPDVELSIFLDEWIEEKKCDIRGNTYDTYKCRIAAIKRFFLQGIHGCGM